MTNFEWLIKSNRLTEFIGDLTSPVVTRDSMECRYGGFPTFTTFEADCANWLCSECIEYIRLDDVKNTLDDVFKKCENGGSKDVLAIKIYKDEVYRLLDTQETRVIDTGKIK